MGLGYVLVLGMALGGFGMAVTLWGAAREMWKKSRWRILAAVPLLLGVLCAGMACYLLGIIWREPPWSFHF